MKPPDRMFWTGLGVGIMAGALLLQLLLAGQGGAALPDPPDGAAVYTAEEAELLVQAAVERTRAEMAEAEEADGDPSPGAQPAPSIVPAASPQPSGSPAASPSARPSPAAAPKGGTKSESAKPSGKPAESLPVVVIRIEPGSSLTETASLLKERNLIASEKGFLDYMEKQRPVPLVRAGYFKIEGKPGLEKLKKILASQPMEPAEGKAWLDKQNR